MNTLPRSIAVFSHNKQVPLYMTNCRLVVTMMTGNKNLLTPAPPLAQLTAHLDLLVAAEELAYKGGMGAVEQRDVALEAVRNDMRLLKAYVQSEADANATAAESLIKSAGMDVKKKRTRTKPSVEARWGKAPGTVVIEAKALPPPVQYSRFRWWQAGVASEDARSGEHAGPEGRTDEPAAVTPERPSHRDALTLSRRMAYLSARAP
jgi:hypothetical protein